MAEADVQYNCHNLVSSTEHGNRPVERTNMGCCDSKSSKYTVNQEDVTLEIQNIPEKEKEETATSGDTGDDTPNDALKQLRQAKTNDDDDYDFDENQHDEEDPFIEMYNCAHNRFEYFWKSQSIYSQWHMSTFKEGGEKFTCAEQYMMYCKAELFKDREIADMILCSTSPRKIKQLGREVRGFVEEVWQYHCLRIVKKGNEAKFSNKKLRDQLIKTYPKTLVEASPYDRIWGIGLEENEPDAWEQSKWKGTNYLGYILTEVRNDIMIEMGSLKEDKRMNFVRDETQKRQPAYEVYMTVIENSKKQVSNKGLNQSRQNDIKGDSSSSSSRSFTSDTTKGSSSSGSNSQKKSKQQSKNKNKNVSGNESFNGVACTETNEQREQSIGKAEEKSLSSDEPRGTEKEDNIVSNKLDECADNTEWRTVHHHHGSKKSKEIPQEQPSSPPPKSMKKKRRNKKNSALDENFESKNRNPPKSEKRDDDNKDEQSGIQRDQRIQQNTPNHKIQVRDSGSGANSSSEPDVSSKQEVTVDAPGKTIPVSEDMPKGNAKLSRRQRKNANKKSKN